MCTKDFTPAQNQFSINGIPGNIVTLLLCQMQQRMLTMLLLGLALQVEIVDMMQVETAVNIEEIMHLCLSCSWKDCLSHATVA